MEKNFQTRHVCDRLASLLLNCADVDFEKRINLLQDLCNEWLQSDSYSLAPAILNCSSTVSDHGQVNSRTGSFSENGSVFCSDAADNLETAPIKIEADEEKVRQYTEDSRSSMICESQIPAGSGFDTIKRHRCPECYKCFRLASQLAKHATTHYNVSIIEDDWRYVCFICTKKFNSANNLVAHIGWHTKNEKCRGKGSSFCVNAHDQSETGGIVVSDQHWSTMSNSSSGTARSESDLCKSDNSSSGAVLPRVRRETASVSSKNLGPIAGMDKEAEAATKPTNRSLRTGSCRNGISLMTKWRMKYPDRKIEPHTCRMCAKQFLQAVQLRKHMIKHAEMTSSSGTPEFPYSCRVCRRHFLFANDLKRHLISHSDDRPYSCVVCRRPFKREDDLAKHMKTHGDVRPYVCDECGERLESATKLRKHVRRVHGDKYECTQCRQYFAKRSMLSRHRRECHSVNPDSKTLTSGEAGTGSAPLPYMCDRCGKSFSFESDLRNHIYGSHTRRRTPLHSCAHCHRQFSSTSHLASHERTHTGDRPYTCDTCGKQFTQSGSLNVHRRTHVEPQPFACNICEQRFASKQYARKHLAMRHGVSQPPTTICNT